MSRYRSKRQVMQKLYDSTAGFVMNSNTSQVQCTIAIPEEVIVKRIVANLIPIGAGATPSFAEGPSLLSVTQSDDTAALAADSSSPVKLIRQRAGGWNGIVIDETITMRKLAGSSVSLVCANLGGSAQATTYFCSLTLHYLEV